MNGRHCKCRNLSVKKPEKNYLEDASPDGKIILKYIAMIFESV
jgi:hypothetical protein